MVAVLGILHSDWLILLFVAGILSGFGLLRFLYDWRHTDNVDVILLFFGSFLITIATVLSGQQDFINSSGQVLTYQGEYWLVPILGTWSLISWLVATISCIVLIVSWRDRRTQKFGRFSSEW